jgi:hypothetical protein
MEQHAASAAGPPQSPWYSIDEAHGCTFRWHRPADFLVWRAHLPELDAARPFDVRATVSPPRWRVRGQGTTKREARPLSEVVRALCLDMDSRMAATSIFDARDSVELLDQSLDDALGMEPEQRSPAKPRRRRTKPSPRAATPGGTPRGARSARRARGPDVSERLHGHHAQNQKRRARKAAAEEGQMFSPRTNLASPRSPAVRRSPSSPPATASPKRRVSADQARRTSDKLYRQAQAQQAKVQELQRQRREQEMQGLFTPRTQAMQSPLSTKAEAFERQMEAGERLHEEATATQELLRQRRVEKVREETAKLTFTPDLRVDAPGKFESTEAADYAKAEVGDRLHKWAVRKQVEKEAVRRKEAEDAELKRRPEMSEGSQLATASIGTNQVERNAAWLRQRDSRLQDAVQQEREAFLVVAGRATLREPAAEREAKRKEWVAKMDGRLQESRERAEEKRQRQEQRELEEVTGTPEISEMARNLERGDSDTEPGYLKGTVISERRRPPDATGMQTSERREADADPGSWIEVEAAYQRRVVAAEAEKHRLYRMDWYKCKKDVAEEAEKAVVEELRQKVEEEIIAKQRLAQAGVRKLATGRLRPRLEHLLAQASTDHEVEPPFEWDEVEVMILQMLTIYMCLTEVPESKQGREPTVGHQWARAEYEDGTLVGSEDANTVAMIDMELLDAALSDPEQFLEELIGQMQDATNRTVRRPKPSALAPVITDDGRDVTERMFDWAQQKEAKMTMKAAADLQEQISGLASKQKFQGQPKVEKYASTHTATSVGKDKLCIVVARQDDGKAKYNRLQPGPGAVAEARQAEADLLEDAARKHREGSMPKMDHSFSKYKGKEGITKHARRITRDLELLKDGNPKEEARNRTDPFYVDTAAPPGEISSIAPVQSKTINASGHEVEALAFSFRVDHPLDGSFLTDRSLSFQPPPKPTTNTTTAVRTPTKGSKARTEELRRQANGGGLGFELEPAEDIPPPSRREKPKPSADMREKERTRQLAEASRKREREQQEARERKEAQKRAAREKAARKKEAAAAAKKRRAGNAADNKQDAELARAAAKGAGSAHSKAAKIAAEAQDAADQEAAMIAEMHIRTKLVQEALTVAEDPDQDQQQHGDDMPTGENTMLIDCPEGVGEGSLLTVLAPDGRELEVEVPPDVGPGASHLLAQLFTAATAATIAYR